MTIHMRIMTTDDGPQVVADCPERDAPVPRVGDYIAHPPQLDGTGDSDIAGCVKIITWRTHDRPARGESPGWFVQAAKPYVELWI